MMMNADAWDQIDVTRAPDGFTIPRQKLYEALQALVGEGALRMRLSYATLPLIQLRSSKTLPAAAQEHIERIVDYLTQEPLMLGSHYWPRFHISTGRSKAIAKDILGLFVDVQGGL